MPTVSSMVSSFNTPAEATEISKRFIGIVPWKIYSAVKEFLKDRNAYVSLSIHPLKTATLQIGPSANLAVWQDYDVPNKCNVKVETTAGAECRTLVNCGPGDNNYQLMPEWNVCYLGGRQYFSRPEIGDCNPSLPIYLQKQTLISSSLHNLLASRRQKRQQRRRPEPSYLPICQHQQLGANGCASHGRQ